MVIGVGAGAVAKKVLDGRDTKAGSLPAALAIGAVAAGGAALVAGKFPKAAMAGALLLGAGALLAGCAPGGSGGTKVDPPAGAQVDPPAGAQVDPPAGRKLLPDGAQQKPDSIFVESYGGKKYLRFDSMVANLGTGAMQIARDDRPDGSASMYQVLFKADGTREEVPMRGRFGIDGSPEHGHLHWEGFEKYQLFQAGADGKPGAQVGDSRKASFYVTNVRQVAEAPASGGVDFTQPADKAASGVETIQQGISAGWADVYGSGIQGQDIDITDVAPGRYVLRQTFDPEGLIQEADEKNNSLDTLLEITADGKANVIDTRYPEAPGRPVNSPSFHVDSTGGASVPVGSSGRFI